MKMNEGSILPEYLVRHTVNDMHPNDIAYLSSKNLVVDIETRKLYISRFEVVTTQQLDTKNLFGKIAIMRVMFDDANQERVDGYIADLRFLDPETIQVDELSPKSDDSFEDTLELDNALVDLVSPLGIIAYEDETMGREVISVPDNLDAHMERLISAVNALYEAIAKQPNKPTKDRARRKDAKLQKQAQLNNKQP